MHRIDNVDRGGLGNHGKDPESGAIGHGSLPPPPRGPLMKPSMLGSVAGSPVVSAMKHDGRVKMAAWFLTAALIIGSVILVILPVFSLSGNPFSATGVIIGSTVIGLLWAVLQFLYVCRIEVECLPECVSEGNTVAYTEGRLAEVYDAINAGAESFLKAEYSICAIFVLIFSVIILLLVSWGDKWNFTRGGFTTLSFLLGSGTSAVSGYLGMKVAVFSNVRTTVQAQRGGRSDLGPSFTTAFRAGAVVGFALCGLGVLMLYLTALAFRAQFPLPEQWVFLNEALTGYGLGGSVIAMFGRVGGGIYTKAADVGADLVGKVVHGIPEDDPRNPATIADNVGDNVGDVAGMGSDLFGSFAESTCAALVIGSSIGVTGGWDAMVFPVVVSAVGIAVCLICSLLATNFMKVDTRRAVERTLKMQLISTTLVMIPATYLAAKGFLPETFGLEASMGVGDYDLLTPWDAWVCVVMGSVGGLIVGLVTEYYTSHTYRPVKEVANAAKTGPATVMIYGIALGYKSVIFPVIVIATVIFGSFTVCDVYGVALAAIGLLSNLATALTIDVYGPVCDNAGGIAEMAEMHPSVRSKTDALDAAGNTTAAIGKGFAIASAAMVSLALFGAFVTRVRYASSDKIFGYGVNILEPLTFAFIVVGGMVPYAFAAMTMKSVGVAAMEMVAEVQRQFDAKPHLLDDHPTERPDYEACIAISTRASLREMVPPGAMVIFVPLLTGIFFGVTAVAGLLVGSLVSSVQLAISMSNSGGAWDNAKKYIESLPPDHELMGKGSEIHKAAVVGDTVGDPFKDTSGPALNIVMKLMAVLSLVFADTFYVINNGRGVFNI